MVSHLVLSSCRCRCSGFRHAPLVSTLQAQTSFKPSVVALPSWKSNTVRSLAGLGPPAGRFNCIFSVSGPADPGSALQFSFSPWAVAHLRAACPDGDHACSSVFAFLAPKIKFFLPVVVLDRRYLWLIGHLGMSVSNKVKVTTVSCPYFGGLVRFSWDSCTRLFRSLPLFALRCFWYEKR